MKSDSGELIHRWLEKVPEGPPPEPRCDRLDIADLEPNGGLPTALEPTDTGLAIRWPRINKRLREEDPDSGQQIPQQSTSNQYQKRPRRKTREDKYEYKRPASRKRTARSHTDKVKRTRTSRKRMINDAFHASNVARDRLTLQNTMNVGIFSRGKASSPIKLRDVRDLSFSETHFLAPQDREPLGTGTGTIFALNQSPLERKLGGQHPRPRASHYFFREPPELANNEPPLVYHEEPSLHHSRGDQLYPFKSPGVVPSPSTAAPPAQDSLGKQDRLHDSQSQLPPHSVQKFSSSTPYTWSVSDRRASQQSRELEDRLLKILHTGLSPRQFSDPSEPAGSRSGYCDIQDLKILLESRKDYWQAQISPELHSLGGVTTLATRESPRESSAMVTSAVQSPIKTAISQVKDSEAIPANGNRGASYGISLDELPRSSQHNQHHIYRGAEPKNDFRSYQPPLPARIDAESVELGAEDDLIFFQELDAAYCAILELKGASGDPLGHSPMVENESHGSLVRHTQRKGHSSHQKRYPSLCGSVDTLFCGQLDHDLLPTSANPSHLPQESLAAFPRNSSTITRPPELTSTRKLLVSGTGMLSKPHSRTAPESCSPIPPGFWRQKRLY